MRIASLLPSATEMVCALGLTERLVGVSHECDYPPVVRGLPKVTNTLIPNQASSTVIDRMVRERLRTSQPLYSLDASALQRLRPDLVVTQSLCNVCAVAEDDVRAAVRTLASTPQVVNLETRSLSQVLAAMWKLGRAADIEQQTERVVDRLTDRIQAVATGTAAIRHRPRVTLLEWLDPPFSCGHWNPELVQLAGGVEGLGQEGQPSRTLRWDEVVEWQPEVIFIACCGFGVERTMEDIPKLQCIDGWHSLPAVRSERVFVADGSQYFNRPGPRLVDSLEILAHVLHPEVHPLTAGLPAPIRVCRRAPVNQH